MKKVALSSLVGLALGLAVLALPNLPAQADAPLVSITGTVVSVDGDVLVVSTDRGNLTFDMDKDTVRPASIAVGSRITVSYDSDDKTTDKMDARRIVMAPAASTPAPTTTTTPTPEPTPTATEDQRELPRTASPLPLVAVLGFVALTGGLMIRRPRGM